MSRKLIIFSLAIIALLAALAPAQPTRTSYAPFPSPDTGYVTDLAHVLTPVQEEEIEQWLWRVEAHSGVEIAVVTINSLSDYPGTPNANIEQFATALFNRWGIGNMPRNNGVLLIVSVGDRKARIELGASYGAMRNAAAARIMENTIVPRFRAGDYPGGIRQGALALIYEFAGMRIGWNWPLICVLVTIPIAIAVAVSLFRHGKRGWGWVLLGLILVLLAAMVWIVFQTVKFLPKSSSSSWSPGGFGGGFGGGFSGGGGATGSW